MSYKRKTDTRPEKAPWQQPQCNSTPSSSDRRPLPPTRPRRCRHAPPPPPPPPPPFLLRHEARRNKDCRLQTSRRGLGVDTFVMADSCRVTSGAGGGKGLEMALGSKISGKCEGESRSPEHHPPQTGEMRPSQRGLGTHFFGSRHPNLLRASALRKRGCYRNRLFSCHIGQRPFGNKYLFM